METQILLNSTPHNLMGVLPHEGNTFGIELELEGRGVGLQDVATRGWRRTNDGSLRGESIEYITNGPKTFEEACKLVQELFIKFQKNKVVFNNSIRTSTHVHLNFSNKPLKQALNFFSLFTLFEEALGYYSGEDRRGNLFCISSREAEGIIEIISRALADGNFFEFRGNRFKYAACNLSTLHKFGTVEVRTMRGATSAEQVNKWLDILNDMYIYSLKMKSPATLVNDLSHLGAEGLMKQVFKEENVKELLSSFPKIKNIHESLIEGARLIQIFAYDFEEAFTKEIEVPKKEVPKKKQGVGGRTPYYVDDAHHLASIYKPDGHAWAVFPERGVLRQMEGAFWQHGQRDDNDLNLIYDENLNRFVVHYPGQDVYVCNWQRHPVFGDEGPGVRRAYPPIPLWEGEEQIIDDFNEDEEDF